MEDVRTVVSEFLDIVLAEGSEAQDIENLAMSYMSQSDARWNEFLESLQRVFLALHVCIKPREFEEEEGEEDNES